MKLSVILIFVGGLIAGAFISIAAYRYATLAPGPREAAARPVVANHPPTLPHPAAPSKRAGEIVIDPAMLQNLGVRTARVEERVITRAIRTTGYVDYDKERVTEVNARISGWVQKLYVAYVGQEVRRGQTLLDVYSPDLVLTQEDYLRSRQLAKKAKGEGTAKVDAQNLMAAADARMRLMGVAPAEVRRLEERASASQTVPIQAPASGVITSAKVVEGSYLKTGADLYTIANLSTVWVYADIFERELPLAHIGQSAMMFSDGLPGKVFQGRITYIYPSVEEKTRTVRLRLEFANPKQELRPGMYVRVTLLDSSPRKSLAVPTEAVLDSGIRRIVIIDLGDGHFMPRQIRIGTESSGYYPVLEGLREGERIVTSGQFLIDSESNLTEALNAMAAGRPHAPMQPPGPPPQLQPPNR